jgi:hypothetical protein
MLMARSRIGDDAVAPIVPRSAVLLTIVSARCGPRSMPPGNQQSLVLSPAQWSLARARSDPFVALPSPLAISRGAVAIGACAFTLIGRQPWLAQRIEEFRGAIMDGRGGVVDHCGV